MAGELRIAVLDDDMAELERVRAALDGLGEAGAEYFTDKAELLRAAGRKPHFDLAFLDVYLRDGTGIDAAEALRAIDPETDLIFITASRDHAVDAFRLRALHYLVKPVTNAGVAEAMDRRRMREEQRPSIQLYVNRVLSRVRLDKIVFLRTTGHLVEVKLTDGQCLRVWQPLSELAGRLDSDFIELNRGVVVNLNEVQLMDQESCTMSDGTSLPLRRRERTDIRRRYNEFLVRELHSIAGPKGRDKQ